MTVEEVLSIYTTSDQKLDNDAYMTLLNEEYTLTPDSPPAIKREIVFVYMTLKKNPGSLDLHDPYIIEAFRSSGWGKTDYLYDAFNELKKNNISFDHLPNADLFKKSTEGLERRDWIPAGAFDLMILDRISDGPVYQPWVDNESTKESIISGCLEIINERYKLCNENGKKIIIEAIISTGLPPTMIPNKVIQDPLFIDSYCSHIGIEGEGKQVLIEVLSSQTITEDLERKLSSILGYENVEDLIAQEILNNPELEDTKTQYGERDKSKDIVLLAAIKLNAIKTLNANGIYDVPIELNIPTTRAKKVASASYNHEKKVIRLNTLSTVSIQEHTKASIHEVNHAIQDYNIQNNNITTDPDIDFYAMDKIIRIISDKTTSNDYYVDNTFAISDEFDADYRAAIYIYNLRNKNNGGDMLLTELKNEIRVRKEKSQTILDEIAESTPYKLDRSRIYKGKRMDIEDAFTSAIEETMSKHPKLWETIKDRIDKDFPILKFKYSFENGKVHRLSPEELVEKLSQTTDEKEREIYIGLIRNSISIRKDLQAKQNLESYRKLLDNSNLPIDIRNDLRIALETPQGNKYESVLTHSDERKC